MNNRFQHTPIGTPIKRDGRTKYRVTKDNYHGMDEQEIRKIMKNTNQFNVWSLLPFILLVIFALMAIAVLVKGG